MIAEVCELALRWMSLDLTDDKSTFVQVMIWCGQATSHYLSQWWPRSLSPYGVARPQWIKHNKGLQTTEILFPKLFLTFLVLRMEYLGNTTVFAKGHYHIYEFYISLTTNQWLAFISSTRSDALHLSQLYKIDKAPNVNKIQKNHSLWMIMNTA